jgi:glycosyltransferase involved in cell wall biosynthesis
MTNRISVRIPIFNQPQLLERCLQSIRNQSFVPAEIILFDDQSTTDYKTSIESFTDLNIKYIRNESNLGAVRNMLNALYYKSECDYILVFHEDDVMQARFIEYSAKAFETNPSAVFCCSLISFFAHTSEIKFINHTFTFPHLLNKQQLINEFLKEKTIGFGTIVYNVNKLKFVDFDFKSYSVFGDRPFMLSLIGKQDQVLYLEQELTAVFDHSHEDIRWKNLLANHALNLYMFYKSELRDKFNKQNLIGSTHGLIYAANELLKLSALSKFIFYLKAMRKNIFSIKYYFLSYNSLRKFLENFRKNIQNQTLV